VAPVAPPGTSRLKASWTSRTGTSPCALPFTVRPRSPVRFPSAYRPRLARPSEHRSQRRPEMAGDVSKRNG
jgi:hypothetical protein